MERISKDIRSGESASSNEPAVAIGCDSTDEREFVLTATFDGLVYFVGAAIIFFIYITARLVFSEVVPLWLLSQKLLYIAALLAIYRQLRRRHIDSRGYDWVLTLVLALCLSSGLLTVMAGLPASFGTYAMILLLGCALVELRYSWAVFHWTCIWAAWMLSTGIQPRTLLSEDFALLLGVQLLAVAAMGLRLRLARMQFQTLSTVARALRESEELRATLDQEVDSRTEQLQAAYEELRLSVQARELIAEQSEKLHEQLLQSQKMESLGRLAGGVAHDFNNLLTVISGNLELARMAALDDEVDSMLSECKEAARRAADLTSQLLAFSRKQVMKVKSFLIQETVRGSVQLIERLLGEDIRLSVKLECPEVVIDGDPSQIQQALINLVVNARDAMPEGGELQIGLQSRGDNVEISVVDTGHGIPADIQDRIFEPFFTSKPLGQGTGLGLATVHGIVSRHGGHIKIESAPGQGAHFTMLLPIAGKHEAEPESGSYPLPALPGNGRVMLVEDDEQVRRLAVRALQISGYQVHPFEDGASALASLSSSSHYDILVTDVVMPGLDGGKLAEAVRAKLPNLPVLFMSGYTDDRLSSFGILRRDDCAFLAKPFIPLALQRAVADVLRAAHRGN